jgi:hypothetical protein
MMKSAAGKKGVVKFVDSLKMKPGMTKEARDVLNAIVDEFGGVTLDDDAAMEMLGRQTHVMSGNEISEWADRVAACTPYTTDGILRWAEDHKSVTGKRPQKGSGPIPGTNESWARVIGSVQKGHRGLESCSFSEFLISKCGARRSDFKKSGADLKRNWIRAQARSHRVATGHWPTMRSGAIPGSNESWNRVHDALYRGGRGLGPDRSSLFQFLVTELGADPDPLKAGRSSMRGFRKPVEKRV